VPKALERAGVDLKDIDLIEMHEAFAVAGGLEHPGPGVGDLGEGQARDGTEAVGKIDRSRLNVSGGSIAIGHPFGATGAASPPPSRTR
jgi:acetyl-CoA acyltransferase